MLRRKTEFQRNLKLEQLLTEINEMLEPVEDKLLQDYQMPQHPIVLIVGMPRCGSTLIMQWLAQTGQFAYPTNLLSRFYGAPAVGARIQQLLTAAEYNFRDELADLTNNISFHSDLGKTKGALEPNEFWYFWRRFIPNEELRFLDTDEIAQVQHKKLTSELAAIEAVFQKPLVMKGMILQLNIPFLSRILDKVLFVFIERHPFYNIQSLLESRAKFYGGRNAWYSIKPQEYHWLKELDPIEQVSGQVYFTVQAIKAGLAQVDESRKLSIRYEQFCDAPQRAWDQVAEKLAVQGYEIEREYSGPQRFQHTNQIRLPQVDCQKIHDAYRRFSNQDLSL